MVALSAVSYRVALLRFGKAEAIRERKASPVS
jgi:hypothetical protein